MWVTCAIGRAVEKEKARGSVDRGAWTVDREVEKEKAKG
jgi:hypothetical protein